MAIKAVLVVHFASAVYERIASNGGLLFKAIKAANIVNPWPHYRSGWSIT
jgi:hypothetical protein